MRAKRIAVAAAGGTLGLVALPLAAMASTAPTGSAAGTAVSVGSSSAPVLGISTTSANSGSSSSGSSADVVNLGGTTLVGGSSSDGSTAGASGDLADTGSASPVEVQVAPYSASSTKPANGDSSSEGKAAVARITAGSVSANVAQSDSKAQYTTNPDGTTTQSGGSTSTDGATLDAPGLSLDLLHSDASSSGEGNAYLLGINGTQIGNRSQLQSICQNLSVPSVLSLNCVTATGGAGNLFEEVFSVVLGPNDSGIPATLFGAGGIGGGAGAAAASPAAVAGTSINGANNPGLSAAPSGAATASSAPGGHLPFTGAPIALWLLASVALVGLGAVTVKTSSLVVPRLYS